MTIGPTLVAALALAALAAIPRPAGAQTLDETVEALLSERAREVAFTVGKRALRRGRRAFALGPTLGAGPAIATEGDLDAHFSAGLALLRYDIEIFISRDRIVEIIEERARQRLLERVASGTRPGPEDAEELVREIVEDVKAELLMKLRPRRFERPRFALALEVGHLASAGVWELRGTIGVGLSRVFISSGLVGQLDDGAALVIPFELGVPMLLSDSLRSPAVLWFARYDLAATDRAERGDRVVVGARLALDIL